MQYTVDDLINFLAEKPLAIIAYGKLGSFELDLGSDLDVVFVWDESKIKVNDFLYDKTRRLLAIGYYVNEQRMDASFYDLLASESRLATFVGIAQGKLPQESWFALGRQLTNVGVTPILLSWSGSMFEYLMPLLVMPSYKNTLLSQTQKSVVEKQIEYGKKRGVPWGISESGYNAVDSNLNYQYRAFGVPGFRWVTKPRAHEKKRPKALWVRCEGLPRAHSIRSCV
mgnify:CR=1 FL=1